jgi:hypothetical protein
MNTSTEMEMHSDAGEDRKCIGTQRMVSLFKASSTTTKSVVWAVSLYI